MCRSRRSARISSMSTWSPTGSSTYRSGCVPRATRPRSPITSPANADAARRLPTPGGPWKTYACAGPSASAAASRRLASSCSGKVSKVIPDDSREVRGRARAVQLADPLREPRGQLLVGFGDRCLELDAFAFDAVGVAACALRGLLRVERDEERAVGKQAARRLV